LLLKKILGERVFSVCPVAGMGVFSAGCGLVCLQVHASWIENTGGMNNS